MKRKVADRKEEGRWDKNRSWKWLYRKQFVQSNLIPSFEKIINFLDKENLIISVFGLQQAVDTVPPGKLFVHQRKMVVARWITKYVRNSLKWDYCWCCCKDKGRERESSSSQAWVLRLILLYTLTLVHRVQI